MKFLFVMLTIRFLFGLLDNVDKKVKVEINTNGFVRHPAEFEIR